MEKSKKIHITVDKKKEDVLRLDKVGYELTFDESLEKFPEYDDEFIKELSFVNQRNYFVAQGLHIGAKRVAEEQPSGLEIMPVTPRDGMATSRLQVFKKKPGFHYAWRRPDELREAQMQGYSIVGDEVETFASSGSKGHHEVSAFGQTELVLMKIPQKIFEERQRAVDSRSKERIEAVENTAVNEMTSSGGKPYIPKSKDSHNWSEAKAED